MPLLRLTIFIVISFFVHSCATQNQNIVVEAIPIPMMSHNEVMTQDFPTKKTVFVRFGTPTSKETFENIENWYFKISEVTNSTSKGLSFGNGLISQNQMDPYGIPYQMNPFVSPTLTIQRYKVTSNTENSHVRTNSTTIETYVKFWFINDSVAKWESLGVDYSRPKIISPVFEQLKYTSEYIFYDSTENINIFSHNSILRKVNSGLNGPMTIYEVNNWLDNHPDFKMTFLPSLADLIKIYHTDSKLSNLIKKQGLIVWSESKGVDGLMKCLDFGTGQTIEKEPQSLNYFVPLVGVPRK
jgi:hypothetical protein